MPNHSWVKKSMGRLGRTPATSNRRRASFRPALEVLEDRLTPSTCTWTGNGVNDLWSNAANWDTGVPVNNDIVVIPSTPNSAAVIFDASVLGGGVSVSSLTSDEPFLLADGSLTVTGALNGTGLFTNAGTLALRGSTVNAPFVNQGKLTALGTNQANAINGAFTSLAGSTVRVESNGTSQNATLTFANGFVNMGIIEVVSLDAGFASNFNVTNGFLVNTDTAPVGIHLLAGAGGPRNFNAQLDNRGVITIDAETVISRSSSAHTNSGRINVNADLLVAQGVGGFRTTGDIVIAADNTFTVSGGTFNYDDGSISGPGTLKLSDTVATFGVDFSNAQTTLLIPHSAINSATPNGPGILTNVRSLTLRQSTVNAPLVNQGTLKAVGTNEANAINGAFTSLPGSTVRVESSGASQNANLTFAHGFVNRGVIEVVSLEAGFASTFNVTNGFLVNTDTALVGIHLLAGAGGPRFFNAQLDNRGVITFDAETFISVSSPAHTNSGTINVNADLLVAQGGATPSFANNGTLNVKAGSTFTLSGGYTQTGGDTSVNGTFKSGGGVSLFDLQGGQLDGNGTIAMTTVNNSGGRVAPGVQAPPSPATTGTLSISGNYTQNGGALNLRIGGTAAGAFDQLAVSGNVQLGGTLAVTFANGFAPTDTNLFPVVTFASNTPATDFATKNFPPFSGVISEERNPTNVTLVIISSDVNNVTPVITAGQVFSIAENSSNNSGVGSVLATDGDVTPTTFQNWSIAGGNTNGAFAINATTGQIAVANSSSLDFESVPTFALAVTVSDGVHTSVAQDVTINIINVSPSAPIDTDSTFAQVPEGSSTGTLVGVTAFAVDPHGGALTYRITNDPLGRFAIGSTSGIVTVANGSQFDFETAGTSISLTIEASDSILTSSTSFFVVVINAAPSAPINSDSTANSIVEGSAAGVFGLTAFASDPGGGAIAYRLSNDAGGRFGIDNTTGTVFALSRTLLNFEIVPNHTITVQADDGHGGVSSAEFVIDIVNVAPSTPADVNVAPDQVPEGAASGTAVGITADATDPNGPAVTYRLGNDAGGRFTIDSSTGVVTVANGALLDFELATGHLITIQASDGNLVSTATFVSIHLTNVAPTTPIDVDATANSVPDHAANDTAVGITAFAVDPSGGAVFYDLIDNAGGRLKIDGSTGVVTVADGALLNSHTATSHTIMVRAFDGQLFSVAASFAINVALFNIPPVAGSDSATVAENSVGNVIDVLANDSPSTDESVQTLTVTSALAQHGAVAINSNGTLSYVPAPNYVGPDTISYTIEDDGTTNGMPDAKTATGTVNVTVVSVDTVPPTVTLSSSVFFGFSNNETFYVQVSFSEPVSGFTVADIVTSNALANVILGSGDQYTVALSAIEQGPVTFDIPAGVATDAAGNGNTAAAHLHFIFDSVAPTVVMISPTGDVTNSSPIPVIVTFSEPVFFFTAGSVIASNAKVENFFAESGAVYRFELRSGPASGPIVKARIGPLTAFDAAFNPSPAAEIQRIFDNVRPTVEMTSPGLDPTGNSHVSVIVTFSEPVLGFNAADIVATNAMVANFVAQTGADYQFDLIPTVLEGLVTANIPALAAFDAAANGSFGAAELQRTFDRVRPAVTMTSPAPDLTSNAPIHVTVTFSEPVIDFADDEIFVQNATVGNFVSVSATVFRFDLTSPGQGLVTADIVADVAHDFAFNGNTAAAQFRRTFDNVRPTITLSSLAPNSVRTSFPVTAVFSEAISGFVASDITVGDGTVVANSLRTDDQVTWFFDVAPANQGLVTVDVAAGRATDAAGNGNTPAGQLSRTFDSVRPSVAITSTAPDPSSNSPMPVTATFSEPVSGFTATSLLALVIDSQNLAFQQNVHNFSGSGRVYTFELTPTKSGLVKVLIAAGVANDVAGNGNLAAVPLTRTYIADNVPPTITLSSQAPNFVTTSFDMRATFSEGVTGFDAGDITVGNGNVSAASPKTDDNITWIFAVAPAGQGLVTVNVAAGGATDAAGNGNSAAAPLSRTFDTVKPTVAITSTAPDPSNGLLMPMTVTFSEPVSGFTAADIAARTDSSNATISNFIAVTPTVYTFGLKPKINGSLTVDIAAGVATDAAGNDNTAAARLTRAVAFDHDGDGIADQIEDAAPGGGDRNGDGIPDSQQASVASVPDINGAYVTMVSQADTKLVNVAITANIPPGNPASASFPMGLFAFDVVGVPTGKIAVVTVTLPAVFTGATYFKYGRTVGNHTPHWYDFTFNSKTGVGGQFAGKILTLKIKDGGPGDDDLNANGTIVDPGAVTQVRLPFADAFTDVDAGDLPPVWSEQVGDFSIRGNQANSDVSLNLATIAGISAADVVVQADVKLPANKDSQAGLLARYSGSGDSADMYWGFLFRLGGRTRAEIYRHTTVLNAWASLADTAVAGNPIGGNLSFEVIGNSLQLFLNGSLIASAVDAKPLMAPGSVGMRSLMNTQFDNFTAKTVFTDTFTQPNGASLIAANWTNQVGAFMIANGGAASGPALNLATSTGFSATDVSVVAYATVVTGGLIGLVARDSGVDYYTGALIDSRGITYATIYRHSAAGFTLLSLVAVSRNPKIRKLRFEAIGSFLSLYVNDRLIASGTDSALPAGSVGMLSIGSGRIDNVKAIPRG